MLLQNTRYGVQHVEFARGGNGTGTDLAFLFLPSSLMLQSPQVAFYGMALLKKERDLSIPSSQLEQMCALFEALDDARVRETHSFECFFPLMHMVCRGSVDSRPLRIFLFC